MKQQQFVPQVVGAPFASEWEMRFLALLNRIEQAEKFLEKQTKALANSENKLKQKIDELEYHSSHDHLTGLLNRHHFEMILRDLLQTSKTLEQEHVLGYLDLDQFKIINDNCGFQAGDELLKQITAVIKNRLRKQDIIARLGGDEFGIILQFCDTHSAMRVAEDLLNVIQDHRFIWNDETYKLSASIGLARVDKNTGDLKSLLNQVDTSCYIAKEQGRARVSLYDDVTDVAETHTAYSACLSMIYKAFDYDRFEMHQQTIAPTDPNHTKGDHFEILVRLLDDNEKLISPGLFLPAAEKYNLMSRLDRCVIEKTFKHLSRYQDRLKNIETCSINLSGQSLNDQKFIEFVHMMFETYQMPPEKICFEITETAAIANLNNARLFIDVMKKRGIRFSLDDFGSGMSSFAYLKNLKVDYLKIDGMFVKEILSNPIDFSMVKSINEIGHVMGLKTIAEFVENDNIGKMLTGIGVDYLQGYGIAKPSSLLEFLQK